MLAWGLALPQPPRSTARPSSGGRGRGFVVAGPGIEAAAVGRRTRERRPPVRGRSPAPSTPRLPLGARRRGTRPTRQGWVGPRSATAPRLGMASKPAICHEAFATRAASTVAMTARRCGRRGAEARPRRRASGVEKRRPFSRRGRRSSSPRCSFLILLLVCTVTR